MIEFQKVIATMSTEDIKEYKARLVTTVGYSPERKLDKVLNYGELHGKLKLAGIKPIKPIRKPKLATVQDLIAVHGDLKFLLKLEKFMAVIPDQTNEFPDVWLYLSSKDRNQQNSNPVEFRPSYTSSKPDKFVSGILVNRFNQLEELDLAGLEPEVVELIKRETTDLQSYLKQSAILNSTYGLGNGDLQAQIGRLTKVLKRGDKYRKEKWDDFSKNAVALHSGIGQYNKKGQFVPIVTMPEGQLIWNDFSGEDFISPNFNETFTEFVSRAESESIDFLKPRKLLFSYNSKSSAGLRS
jgi:hypothetical protein